MNNEVVGISTELAIADVFDLYVNPRYRERGDEYIKDSLMDCVIDAFESNLFSSKNTFRLYLGANTM